MELNQSQTSDVGRRSGNKWIAPLIVGLVIGLLSGVLLSSVLNLPALIARPNIENPVEVSGTVSFAQSGTIQFINWNETENTRYDHHTQIVSGSYSITLSGGKYYAAIFGLGQTGAYPDQFEVYIPSNVTSFTANF